MEKIRRESKTHMKYPAPYSQSWAGMHHPRRSSYADRTASRMKTFSATASNDFFKLKTQSRHRQEPPERTYIGQDPTVPHLKYGIFKKPSRNASSMLASKPSIRLSSLEASSVLRPRCMTESKRLVAEPSIAKVSTVQKLLKNSQKAEGEYNLGPVFVFRPLEPRSLRALTISPSTHLDIKPGLQRTNNFPPSRNRRLNIGSSNMIYKRKLINQESLNNVGYRQSNIINMNNDSFNNVRDRNNVNNGSFNNVRNRTNINNGSFNNVRDGTNINNGLFNNVKDQTNINSDSFNNVRHRRSNTDSAISSNTIGIRKLNINLDTNMTRNNRRLSNNFDPNTRRRNMNSNFDANSDDNSINMMNNKNYRTNNVINLDANNMVHCPP